MYGELDRDEQYLVFCIGYNVSTVFFYSNLQKEVLRVQGEWYSPNTIPTMVISLRLRIPKKFFVCIFILDYLDEDTDKKILRNPNLNEITTIVHGQA
jgi:hypothetical protein